MATTSGLSRRRNAGSGLNSTNSSHESTVPTIDRTVSTENGVRIAVDPNDVPDKEDKNQPNLTLMEEVLLLGLKDKQGYLSFWNDNISYTLRGCILMELAFRGRIAMVKDYNRRKVPLSERTIEVIDDRQTNEVLLDEALKMMKQSETMSVGSWIDLMSGETWNVLKIGYQLKQVRERLAKGLVDKGILRTEKRNFLLFDMATHPVSDSSAKDEIVKRVIKTLTHVNSSAISSDPDIPFSQLRTVSMVCAAYAANVLENALVQLSHEMRERAYTKVDELLSEYSSWPFSKKVKVDIPEGKDLQIEVVAAVLNVFTKMDSIL
ncbi:17030_t:CDS:2 [Gigaspora margarita]|uniref:Golgi phospho protein 3 domain-containing protein n=3 Tax=Gigaspora TaxID=4873 RepID=A0A397UC10_9GLOM|nr:Golgi phospho protein 3 [Gigaspora margarita]RIB06648.1 Golgi phospho protein 3 domain-containing protein [Gigaspora rosea]CAG8622047.1 19798_t:CDS:2 [Gigaspora rosea]CAG8765578.1 17030_t:CDS:2 [Gigaspora margarita]